MPYAISDIYGILVASGRNSKTSSFGYSEGNEERSVLCVSDHLHHCHLDDTTRTRETVTAKYIIRARVNEIRLRTSIINAKT